MHPKLVINLYFRNQLTCLLMNLFKRIRLLHTVRNGIIQSAAVVARPGLKLCNPYFLISETNGRNASMNNSLIRVFNVKREIILFNLPQLRYTTSNKCMFIALFELLFYIVHCCIDIEDRSFSGLYFNKIILSYLILRVYASGLFTFRNSKRSLSFYSTTINTFLIFLTGYKLLSIRDMTTVFPSRYMSVLLLGIKIDT